MIQELLYTSHEGKGLRQGGGGGFCTVLSTTGMAPNLASALEQLSGYKHPFDIHDARSASNPINFRHAVIRVGGITYHVLSRIADLRREHTGRSNKLAHHIALTKEALAIGGPSAVLGNSEVCRTNWDGNVKLVPEIPVSALPQQDLPLERCQMWERVSGDAGWGGAVVEHLLNSQQSPISIIAPLNTDTLSLVTEVLALMPPKDRWGITFSTYFTSLPAGTSCSLRFFLDGTQEADLLRRDYRQKSIDLASKLAAPRDSEWVTVARTGKRVATATKSVVGHGDDFASGSDRVAEPSSTSFHPGQRSQNPPLLKKLAIDDELELEAPINRGSSSLKILSLDDGIKLPTRHEKSRSKAIWIGLAAVLMVTLVATIAGVGWFAISTFSAKRSRQNENADTQQKDSDKRPSAEIYSVVTTENAPTNKAPIQPATPDKHTPAQPVDIDKNNSPAIPAPGSSETQRNGELVAKAKVVGKEASAKELGPPDSAPGSNNGDTIKSIPNSEALKAVVKIPPLNIPRLSKKLQSVDELLYGGLPLGKITNVQLIGFEQMKFGDYDLVPEFNRELRTLTVSLAYPNNFTRIKNTLPSAVFTFPGSDLNFQWTPKATELPESTDKAKRNLLEALRWCQLKFEINGNAVYTVLSPPFPGPKIRLSELSKWKNQPIATIALPAASNWETNVEMTPLFSSPRADIRFIGPSDSGSSFHFACDFPASAGGKHDLLVMSFAPNKPTSEALISATATCTLYLPAFTGERIKWEEVDDGFDLSIPAKNASSRFEKLDHDISVADKKLIDEESEAKKKKSKGNARDPLKRRRDDLEDAKAANQVLQAFKAYLLSDPTFNVTISAKYVDAQKTLTSPILSATVDSP